MENRTWWVPSADGDLDKTQTRKGPWTIEEDMHLLRYISLHGEGRWNFLAKAAGLKRTGKSCRLRWNNCLRPDLKRSKITPEEERLIIELHGRWGNRWSRIAHNLPGRTDNDIKNHWRTRIKKKINLLAQSSSRGSKAASYCLITSSEKPSDLDSAEHNSSSFPRQNTEELEFQTSKIPYLLADDIWAQAIPFSEGNYDYKMQGEIHGSSQINEDEQPGLTLLEHFDGLDNLFEESLLCNFSLRSVTATLISSELFGYGTTEDGKMPPSFSFTIDSPEAFSDSECYLNDYSDVLWKMGEEDERFRPHSTSSDDRRSY